MSEGYFAQQAADHKLRWVVRDEEWVLQERVLDLNPDSPTVGKWAWLDVPVGEEEASA